jgi:hypothetical protein
MAPAGLLVTVVEGSDHPYRGEEDGVCLLLLCSGEGVAAGNPQYSILFWNALGNAFENHLGAAAGYNQYKDG